METKQVKTSPKPIWLTTPVIDVGFSVYDINTLHHKEVYVFMAITDGAAGLCDIDMIVCYTIHDIAYYAHYFKVFSSLSVPEEDRILIRGEVLDPKELPNSIPQNQKAFLFCNDWWMEEYEDIDSLTTAVENSIEDLHLNIEDVAIVVGNRTSDDLVQDVNKKIKIFSMR